MPLVSVLASLHWIQATDANFTGNYAYCILFIFSISSVYILYTGSKYCKHLHKILLYTEVFKICMHSDEQSLYGWFSTHWTTWWLQCGTGMSDSYYYSGLYTFSDQHHYLLHLALTVAMNHDYSTTFMFSFSKIYPHRFPGGAGVSNPAQVCIHQFERSFSTYKKIK